MNHRKTTKPAGLQEIISKWSSILVLTKINGKIMKKVKKNVKKI